jgi:hypothetical protein
MAADRTRVAFHRMPTAQPRRIHIRREEITSKTRELVWWAAMNFG